MKRVGERKRSALSSQRSLLWSLGAEGCGRGGDAELRRFLQVAMGSASELEYHLLLAHDLHYLETAKYQGLDEQVTEVKRMLASFIQKLKAEC